jgi:hypothetical protein
LSYNFLKYPQYQADPRLLETVDGLSPSAEKHQFFIDIQPVIEVAVFAQ